LDTILNFEDRWDTIEIRGLPLGPGIHAMNDLLIEEVLGNAVIALASDPLNNQITLVGIPASLINHQDIQFMAA